MNRAEGKAFFKMREADGTTLATKTELVFAPVFFAIATLNFAVGTERSGLGLAPRARHHGEFDRRVAGVDQ